MRQTHEQLIYRTADLKREMLRFAAGPRCSTALKRAFHKHFGKEVADTEAEVGDLIDTFLLRHRLSDGRTLVEHFVDAHPNLSEAERAMLLGWKEIVEGVFRAKGMVSKALVVFNLVDELTYHIRSNMGASFLSRIRSGSFVVGRILPIGHEWVLSGYMVMLPAASRNQANRVAAQLAMEQPARVFRNPKKLEQAWEFQREQRRHFIAFFGSDLVVVRGSDLADRIRDYAHYITFEVRDASGLSPADRARKGDMCVQAPDIRPPQDFFQADSVAVTYDDIDGLCFFNNYLTVEETFATPALCTDHHRRKAVLAYLNEPSIPPSAIRRLAARDHEKASEVLGRVLRQSGFSWERDGAELLCSRKASYFQHPRLPSLIPLSPALAQSLSAGSIKP